MTPRVCQYVILYIYINSVYDNARTTVRNNRAPRSAGRPNIDAIPDNVLYCSYGLCLFKILNNNVSIRFANLVWRKPRGAHSKHDQTSQSATPNQFGNRLLIITQYLRVLQHRPERKARRFSRNRMKSQPVLFRISWQIKTKRKPHSHCQIAYVYNEVYSTTGMKPPLFFHN